MSPDDPEIRVDHYNKSKDVGGDTVGGDSTHGDVVSSMNLLKGRRQLTILHGNERYQLRLTTNDKLILTK